MKKVEWDRDKKEEGIFDLICVVVLTMVILAGIVYAIYLVNTPSDDKEAVKESQPLEFDCEKHLPIWYERLNDWSPMPGLNHSDTVMETAKAIHYLKKIIDDCESGIKDKGAQ